MLNAVFAATGKWIRQRPLKDTALPKALGCDLTGQIGAQAPRFSRLLRIRQSVSAGVDLHQDLLPAEAADRAARKGHDGVIELTGHQHFSQPLLYLGFGGNCVSAPRTPSLRSPS